MVNEAFPHFIKYGFKILDARNGTATAP